MPTALSPAPTHPNELSPTTTAPRTDRRRSLRRWMREPTWNRFTPVQLVVMALATIAPVVITGTIAAALTGLISLQAMLSLALVAGEDPGMITFGAMFLASPVQWLTGRSQVRVRKYLGVTFFLLALSNGAMFAIESGVTAMLGAPFLIAGTIALVAALPLFLTSSRRAQRNLGMRNWRNLHKITYLIAAALVAHILLMGEIGPGFVLIALGFVTRTPAIKRRITDLGARRKERRHDHLRSTEARPATQ